MRVLPLFLIIPLLLSFAAHATSRRNDGTAKLTAPYCEILARFGRPTHWIENINYGGTIQREAHVAWVFDIESTSGIGGGLCPEGASFELAIRGADVVETPNEPVQYVYPTYVEALAPNTRVLVRAREIRVTDPRTGRQFKEWLVINWTQGIEKK